jgi:hypothetical protein
MRVHLVHRREKPVRVREVGCLRDESPVTGL